MYEGDETYDKIHRTLLDWNIPELDHNETNAGDVVPEDDEPVQPAEVLNASSNNNAAYHLINARGSEALERQHALAENSLELYRDMHGPDSSIAVAFPNPWKQAGKQSFPIANFTVFVLVYFRQEMYILTHMLQKDHMGKKVPTIATEGGSIGMTGSRNDSRRVKAEINQGGTLAPGRSGQASRSLYRLADVQINRTPLDTTGQGQRRTLRLHQ